MHWRGNEQLWSVQFHFFEFSAAFAPFEVLSPQDFECQRQKNLSAFQWLRHRSLFTNANFVLDMSSILISTWIGNLISKRWCLLEAHHTLWSGSDVSMLVGTQLLHSVSFTAPRCWLLIVYGSSLLIVIFPPDCNCWSWLSAVDCGDQWWERRKPARWERGATTTTAGGRVCNGSGGLGQKFCKISPQTHVRWDPNWVNLQVLLAVLCLKYWVPKTADNKKSAKCARIVPDFSGPF